MSSLRLSCDACTPICRETSISKDVYCLPLSIPNNFRNLTCIQILYLSGSYFWILIISKLNVGLKFRTASQIFTVRCCTSLCRPPNCFLFLLFYTRPFIKSVANPPILSPSLPSLVCILLCENIRKSCFQNILTASLTQIFSYFSIIREEI